MFTISQVRHSFSHGFTFELKAMSVMHQAVKNGISERVITDADIPLISGKLADDQGRSMAMAIIHDLQQVISMGWR